MRLPGVFLGKRQLRVDDFFAVEGEGGEELEIRGDAKQVKWVGRGMTHGRINVAGNIGMHLGAYMRGGAIEVSGDASDWVGGEMSDGLIHIRGNAGGQAGRGISRQPRRNALAGTILIEGTAGLELGSKGDEAGDYRRQRAGKGLRRLADGERRYDFFFLGRLRRDSDGRLDDSRYDRLAWLRSACCRRLPMPAVYISAIVPTPLYF